MKKVRLSISVRIRLDVNAKRNSFLSAMLLGGEFRADGIHLEEEPSLLGRVPNNVHLVDPVGVKVEIYQSIGQWDI